MPELPEVETVRRTLLPVVGARITQVWTSGLPLRLNQPVDESALRAAAVNREITDVRRRGKYLLVDCSAKAAATGKSLVVHLGMSGRFRLMKPDQERAPHTHVVFSAIMPGGGAVELRYSDPRRFGQVTVAQQGAEESHPALAVLGIDPIVDPWGGEELHELSRVTKKNLKAFLLDQRAIAGIGNIYASEALWQAKIRPTLRAHRLSRPRADRLADAVKTVLDRALSHGGTSLKDFVDAHGVQGDHSHYLWVYDRAGQPCKRDDCTGLIRRTVDQGRATFSCPRCQVR